MALFTTTSTVVVVIGFVSAGLVSACVSPLAATPSPDRAAVGTQTSQTATGPTAPPPTSTGLSHTSTSGLDPTFTAVTPVSAVPTFSVVVPRATSQSTATAATLLPTSTPAPRPPSNVNLKPVPVSTDRPPLSVRSAAGGTIASKTDVLVDWYAGQDGTESVSSKFYVDLYLDDIPVNRWHGAAFPLESYLETEDWAGLLDEFELAPGEHSVRLVVDPTDLINESNESDNSVSVIFRWAGPGPVAAISKKLPDLTAGVPIGRSEAVVVSPDPDAQESGRLSVDAPVHIAVGVVNHGVASVRGDAVADLYLDSVWLHRLRWSDLVASTTGYALWDEFEQTVIVAAGPHTMRLVIDPSNLVYESNESDNVYEATYVWATTAPAIEVAVPTPTPTAAPTRKAKSLPDFAPVVLYAWDASIAASSDSAADAAGRDGPLSADSDAYVSYAFWNASPASTGRTVEVDLFVDGQKLDTQGFTGGSEDAGSNWSHTFKLAAGTVKSGQHTIRVQVDPDGEIAEAAESNNVFERKFTWLNGPLPAAPKPITHTGPELRALLAPAIGDGMLVTADLGGPVKASKDWTQATLDAAEAGYYLVTGRSLKDERLTVHMLTRPEYDDALFQACMHSSEALSQSEYDALYADCSMSESKEIGFKTRLDGRIHVFADTEHSPAEVLGTLFHEFGHARQDFSNPAQTEAGASILLNAVQEAAAQVFEAAAWRRIEELTGTPLLSYPDFAGMREVVQTTLDETLQGAVDQEEHNYGYVLMWLTALADPAGLGLANEMSARGSLSASATVKMFEYIAGLKPSALGAWANALIARQQELVPKYAAAALGRLKANLPPDAEGHPDLLDTSVLAP